MVSLAWLAHSSKLVESGHAHPQKFLQGVKRRHFAYHFQVADIAMQTDVPKRFTVSTPQRKCPMKARALFAPILKSFSSGAVAYRPTNLPQKCTFCHPLQILLNRRIFTQLSLKWLELSINTFAVLSLVFTGWTELTSEIFCPNCFLHFAY